MEQVCLSHLQLSLVSSKTVGVTLCCSITAQDWNSVPAPAQRQQEADKQLAGAA